MADHVGVFFDRQGCLHAKLVPNHRILIRFLSVDFALPFCSDVVHALDASSRGLGKFGGVRVSAGSALVCVRVVVFVLL